MRFAKTARLDNWSFMYKLEFTPTPVITPVIRYLYGKMIDYDFMY